MMEEYTGKWEYLTLTNCNARDLERLGQNGWELVCVILLPNADEKYFFKQPTW